MKDTAERVKRNMGVNAEPKRNWCNLENNDDYNNNITNNQWWKNQYKYLTHNNNLLNWSRDGEKNLLSKDGHMCKSLFIYSNDTCGSYLDLFSEKHIFSFKLYGIFAIVHETFTVHKRFIKWWCKALKRRWFLLILVG